MIPFTEAAVIATFVQAILYGLYISTLLHCLRWLTFRDEGWSLRKDIKWPMLIVTIAIFALSTSDIAASLVSTLRSLRHQGTILFTGIITFTLESLAAVITDAVLVFRCWVVYSKSWRIAILPLLLLLVNVALLIITTYLATINLTQRHDAVFRRLDHLNEAFYACTIAINIYATSAIIFRIWSVARKNNTSGHRLRFTIRIVAESGLLYTLTSIMLLCATSIRRSPTGNPLPQILLSALNFSMTGIAFNLILIRAAQHRVSSDSEDVIEKQKSLSMLRFHAPESTRDATTRPNGGSVFAGSRLDVEQGIHETIRSSYDNTQR
ncbi:hypothetical protein AX17_003611 [Amanita inopinata Kibby_2008]|nr:hypothetical protein AX17_003611 [Amanita inopinata Kibby_2008]